MYLVKTPRYIKAAYPSLIWDIKKQNTLFLTFDDGPAPQATDKILNMLADYNAKATFFCIGKNVQQHIEIYNEILLRGHATGNHTFHHLNGWKTDTQTYMADVAACQNYVTSNLFRPPYGRITPQQIKALKKQYKIIMWDVLSGDFDEASDANQCTKNVIENATDGSVIVFHDSEKCGKKVIQSLPAVLEYFSGNGFAFDLISAPIINPPFPIHND